MTSEVIKTPVSTLNHAFWLQHLPQILTSPAFIACVIGSLSGDDTIFETNSPFVHITFDVSSLVERNAVGYFLDKEGDNVGVPLLYSALAARVRHTPKQNEGWTSIRLIAETIQCVFTIKRICILQYGKWKTSCAKTYATETTLARFITCTVTSTASQAEIAKHAGQQMRASRAGRT